MPERRYDEKEVGEIFRTAVEIQVNSTSSSPAGGFTMEELQRVSGEVGIEPKHIAQAVEEYENTRPVDAEFKPDTSFLECTVAAELTDETWDDMVTRLRVFTGKSGKQSSNGTTREWSGNNDVTSVTLTARSVRGRTKLQLMTNTSGATGAAVVLATVPGVLLTVIPAILTKKHVISLGAPELIVVCILVAIGWALGSLAWLRSYRRNYRTKTEELMKALRATVTGNVKP